MRFLLISFVALNCFCAEPAFAEFDRWFPAHCDDQAYGEELNWNKAYLAGITAIGAGTYELAEVEMCRALLAARDFDARDWRFAETLDELGLIAFQLNDFELAERVQGAAIAEMLLAVGPHGEPLQHHHLAGDSVLREDCASGVSVYTARLGWIHQRVDGAVSTDHLKSEPWLIFAGGYLPHDSQLADRLDWLVSQYLLLEQLNAADALSQLQSQIRSQFDKPGPDGQF